MTYNKPTIGSEVKYTDIGKGVYYQINKCWPANDGVLGVVESFSAAGRICTVRNSKGETESFIWRFANGMNDHFEWPGKSDERRAQDREGGV